MSGSGGALWGSAPGGPGGGMGIEVGPPWAGGRLGPPGIGARAAALGSNIVFGAAIGVGPRARVLRRLSGEYGSTDQKEGSHDKNAAP